MVAGASSHPGKSGFVTLHNNLSQGYAGGVYADEPATMRRALRHLVAEPVDSELRDGPTV